jgi:hypothetical protein
MRTNLQRIIGISLHEISNSRCNIRVVLTKVLADEAVNYYLHSFRFKQKLDLGTH